MIYCRWSRLPAVDSDLSHVWHIWYFASIASCCFSVRTVVRNKRKAVCLITKNTALIDCVPVLLVSLSARYVSIRQYMSRNARCLWLLLTHTEQPKQQKIYLAPGIGCGPTNYQLPTMHGDCIECAKKYARLVPCRAHPGDLRAMYYRVKHGW